MTFDVAGADALPSLRGDPDKLAQLFLNVLDNAVKHSPRGATVHVRGSRDNGAVMVRVRDAGSGLPEGAQTRLFQRFYRGDVASMARRSSAPAPGIVSRLQVRPPSVVWTTVPRWPQQQPK